MSEIRLIDRDNEGILYMKLDQKSTCPQSFLIKVRVKVLALCPIKPSKLNAKVMF